MTRPLRIQYPGALYHVTNRGNERKPIFKDDADRLKFIEILAQSTAIYSVRIYSFVLMGNHFHLLLETPLGNLSEFMRHFNITYTSAFNRRYKRIGHLYQGRYKSIVVDKDAYLSMVSRYIHLNPVKVGMVNRKSCKEQLQALWSYPWSSLPGFLSTKKREAFVDYGVVLQEYGGDTPAGRSRYKKTLVGDLVHGLPVKEKILAQCLLGEEPFVTRMQEKFFARGKDREQPAVAEIRRYLAKDEILAALSDVSGVAVNRILTEKGTLRQLAMDLLYRLGGLTNPKIGRLMGLDYSTVSQGRMRLQGKLGKDTMIRKIFNETEARLSRIKI